jgi:hypothetical protein
MNSLDTLLQKYGMSDKNLIKSAKGMVDAISKYSNIPLNKFNYTYDKDDNFIMLTIKNKTKNRTVYINCYDTSEYHISMDNEFYWIAPNTIKENIEFIENYIV